MEILSKEILSNLSEYLTVNETAEILGFSPSKVRYWKRKYNILDIKPLTTLRNMKKDIADEAMKVEEEFYHMKERTINEYRNRFID